MLFRSHQAVKDNLELFFRQNPEDFRAYFEPEEFRQLIKRQLETQPEVLAEEFETMVYLMSKTLR